MSVYHIGIVDYGMGNLYSVRQAIQATAPLGTQIHLCRTAADLKRMDRLVFPGQGAMPDAMQAITSTELHLALQDALISKPVLAICVGHQMLLDYSSEGNVNCLQHFSGDVVRLEGSAFEGESRLKIPHIGWNYVRYSRNHALWKNIPDGSAFYFVHSYYARPAQVELTAAVTQYGLDFCSAMARDYVFSVQFHPEKSAKVGLELYHNFSRWNP